MNKITFIVCILFTFSVGAKVLKKEKNGQFTFLSSEIELDELLTDYAEIKKYNLYFDRKLEKKATLWGPHRISEKSLELFVTSLLEQYGKTLLVDDKLRQINVMSSRDIRYHNIRIYEDVANVPNNYSFVQLIIPLKFAGASDVSRNMRPFLSRYGRVIDDSLGNKIVLADTAVNAKRLHKLIKKLDTKKFKERELKTKEINKKFGKREVVKKLSFLDILKQQQVLFLLTFSLIGLILGFGIRGYMMKRVEGGW